MSQICTAPSKCIPREWDVTFSQVCPLTVGRMSRLGSGQFTTFEHSLCNINATLERLWCMELGSSAVGYITLLRCFTHPTPPCTTSSIVGRSYTAASSHCPKCQCHSAAFFINHLMSALEKKTTSWDNALDGIIVILTCSRSSSVPLFSICSTGHSSAVCVRFGVDSDTGGREYRAWGMRLLRAVRTKGRQTNIIMVFFLFCFSRCQSIRTLRSVEFRGRSSRWTLGYLFFFFFPSLASFYRHLLYAKIVSEVHL